MSLNFSTDPYYDDYDELKKFYRILFRPSVAVQARELTQIQSILQNQIRNFGKHLFQEGSQVIGLGQTVDMVYSFVKIEPTFNSNAVTYSNFLNKTITGATSGAKAFVRNIGDNVDGADANTLYIKYITATKFAEGENIVTNDATPFSAKTKAPGDGSHIGDAIALSVNAGILFSKGFFVTVDAQTIVPEAYTTNVSKRIGFRIVESIVTPDTDNSLNDPAQGTNNFAAPGAHRYKIEAELEALDLDSTDDADFVEIVRFENGIIKNQVTKTAYADIMKMISRRTYDESGNYTVKPFKISIDEVDGDSTKLKIGISPAKAYIQGYEIELQSTRFLNIDKARDTRIKNNANISANYGNYLEIENLSGLFNPNKMQITSIRDDTIANGQGLEIGTCRIRQIKKTSSNEWQAYIFDVSMKKGVQSVTITDGGAEYAVNDTLSFSGGGGSGATAKVSAINGSLASVSITNGGTKYQVGDDIVISGTTGDGASAKVASVDSNGVITAIQVTNGGSNYSTAPSVTISRVTEVTLDAASLTIDVQVGADITFGGGATGKAMSAAAAGSTLLRLRDAPDTGAGLFSGSLTIVNPDSTTGTATKPVSNAISQFTQATLVGVGSGTGGVFGEITQVTVTDGGGGYTSAPTITSFSSDSITDTATGTATIGDIVFADRAKGLLITSADSGRAYDTKADVILTNNKAIIQSQGNNTLVYSITPGPIKDFVADETNYSVQRMVENVSVGSTSPYSFTVSLAVDSDDFKGFDGFNYMIVSRSSFGATGSAGDEIILDEDQIDLNSSTNVATFSTEANYGNQLSGKTVDVIISLFKSETNQRTKTLTTQTAVTLTPNADDSIDLKDSLGNQKYDIYNGDDSLIVLDSSDNSDITKKYTLDNGQRDNFYDYGSLTLNEGETAPIGNVKVTFKHFVHGAGDYFTVNSYPSTVYDTIPTFIGQNSKLYNLRDCIDFRPNVENYSGGHEIPLPNDTVVFDFDYYLPRVDKIAINLRGDIVQIKGISDINPQPPKDLGEAMSIFQLTIPAYTFQPQSVITTKLDNKVYTMKDIGDIERRVSNLEYYTSLNLLEQDANNVLITDESGLPRTKNGIVVDNFTSYGTIDVGNSEYYASIDTANGLLLPKFYSAYIPLEVNSSSGLSENANTFTLAFENEVFIEQPFASDIINVQEFSIVDWIGGVSLIPTSDDWFDNKQAPDVITNFDDNYENWQTLSRSAFGSVWNDWQTIWSGTTSDSYQTNTRGFIDGGIHNITSTYTTNVTTAGQTRTGTGLVVTPSTVNYKLGDTIVDLSIIPYMRSREIEFDAKKLRPSTQFFVFVDDIDVTQFCYPLTGTEKSTGAKTLDSNPFETSNSATLNSSPTFTTTNGSKVVTVHHTNHGQTLDLNEQARYMAGNQVTISGVTGAVNGIPITELNTTHTIQSVVDADSYTIEVETTNATTSGTYSQSGVKSVGTGTLFGTNPRIVRVTHAGHGMEDDQLVSFTDISADDLNGIDPDFIQGTVDDSVFSRFHHHVHNVTTDTYCISLASEVVNGGIYHTNQGLDLPQKAHNNSENPGVIATASGTTGGSGIKVHIHGGTLMTDELGQINGVLVVPNARFGTYNAQTYSGNFAYGHRRRAADTARDGEPTFSDAISKTLRFRTGERKISLSENRNEPVPALNDKTSYGFSMFEASGLFQEKSANILSTRVAQISTVAISDQRVTTTVTQSVSQEDRDPLAQTFIVTGTGQKQSRGSFITNVGLFFRQKDDTLPVTVEIREVVNGFPGANIIPFGSVTLNPSDINVSADASIETTFNFSDPIYLLDGTEYCMVVLSNSTKYQLYVAVLGDVTLDGTRLISQVPYAGSLFESQNNRTWTPDQSKDLKFIIRRAKFTTTNGTLSLQNKKLSAGLEDMGPPTAIGTTDNYHYNTGFLQIQDLALTNTTIAYTQKTANSSGSLDSAFSDIKNKQNFNYTSERRLDGNTDTRKLFINAEFTRPDEEDGIDEYVSPVIDKERMSFLVIGNRIGSTAPKGVYVTKTVTLEDASDDIKVFLTASKPNGTTLNVYYKAATANQNIDDLSWQLMDLSNTKNSVIGQNNNNSVIKNDDNFFEYEYDPTTNPPLEDFITFKIKIEMTTTNTSVIPKVKDMRVIAHA